MDDSKQQKVSALRERLSPEQRALLARRLAASVAPLASADLSPEVRPEVRPELRPDMRPDATPGPGLNIAPDTTGARSQAVSPPGGAPPRDLRAAVAAAARAAAVTHAPGDEVLQAELAAWRADDAHAVALVCQVLARLGYRAGDGCAVSDLAERLGSRPLYTKLLSRWLVELSMVGVAAQRAEGVQLRARFAEVIARTPAGAPPAYWPKTAEQLIAVLGGETHILELMDQAGGVFENVKGYHRDTGRSRYFNAIVAAAVQAYARTAGARLRILEIGAGVGGTTGPVLDALPRGGAAYDFTDLSDAFFEFARSELARYRELRYRTLDMNRRPSEQGFEEGTIDIVLASNALHCARDLRVTSAWLRGLLRSGGMLVIRELTAPRPAHMVIPGLIPGFSDFSDDRLRDNTPLLSQDAWRRVLEGSGFASVAAFPSGGGCELLGEHVIVAWRAPHDAWRAPHDAWRAPHDGDAPGEEAP